MRSPNRTARSWRRVKARSGISAFPDSVEGIRHFRRMLERTVQRLTSEEIDSLIKSLKPEK